MDVETWRLDLENFISSIPKKAKNGKYEEAQRIETETSMQCTIDSKHMNQSKRVPQYLNWPYGRLRFTRAASRGQELMGMAVTKSSAVSIVGLILLLEMSCLI